MEEKLVLAITGYPELYDFSYKNYQNKHLKQAAWSRVSFAVDRSVKECQKKWKYLRDEYLKQRRMEKERRSGAEGGMRKRWKYMGILSFLEPYRPYIPYQIMLDTYSCLSAPAASPSPDSEPPSPSPQPGESAPQCTIKRPEKPRKRQADQQPLSEYQKRLLAAVDRPFDENEHFFLGLVPQLKRLPPIKGELQCKMKIAMLKHHTELVCLLRSKIELATCIQNLTIF
ncbi:hypothetical protein ACEWY4_013983 [Coilia grayii]|uniref:MADF domain-containing protein n=1 Tax=Coilia grayii TaxID=363190 RepID=A0ABD1JQZ7_9TELE